MQISLVMHLSKTQSTIPNPIVSRSFLGVQADLFVENMHEFEIVLKWILTISNPKMPFLHTTAHLACTFVVSIAC